MSTAMAAFDYSGNSVSAAGDVNGDGVDDLLIGANEASPNGSYSGASYVVFGAVSEDPVINSPATASVAENQLSAIDVQATDNKDSEGAGLTFTLSGGADQALFDIDVNTGVVTFITAPDFQNPTDAGADNNYDFQVTVTDSDNLTAVQDIVISVTDVVENTAPIITSATSASVNENQTSVIDIDTTDDFDSEGAGLTYSLTGTIDDALFDIDADSGVVTFITAPDFENPTDFGADNDYDFQVTVTDLDGLTAVQDIVISVTDVVETLPTVTLDIPVSASSDDAEERTSTGKMNRGSSDLELVEQGVKDQLMGIRFNGLTIPAGATITNAYIQFQVDETDSRTTNLMITGHATDNAPTFTTANANISSRDRTNAVVDWSLVPWTTVGEAGPDQQTPDITSLVQEIVERPGWSSGNSLAVIITGSGRRPAESYDGDVAGAPTLHVEYTQATVTNQAPTVNGGSDQSVSLPAGGNVDAILNGTVSDDGLPIPVGVTTTWSQVSGPSTVIFGDANAEDTSANFDTAGSYVLRLTADDGDLSSFAEITVTVNAAGSATIVEVSVSASNDDAEEKTATGKMDRGSSDLELVDQGSNNQLVGMRFNNLSIPQSATITNAYLQFQVDETHSGSAALMIEGEATDDAQAFTTANGNISSRNLTGATVNWAPAPWTTVGDTGADQQTPDLTSVVQEIVDRSGWSSGNSLVIIISGNGLRTAESFNGDAAGAPRLHVEYQ
jgi:hypothetical protein